MDLDDFQLALGLWVESADISRNEYRKLVEVLNLLDAVETRTLPEKLDTLKERLHKKLPLQPVERRQIPVQKEAQPTQAANSPTDEILSWHYWFDPQFVFRDILSSRLGSEKIHFGMAQYCDKPIELWHSRAWGSSICAASGEFTYSRNGDALFPGDFVQFKAILIRDCNLKAEFGRVIFFGLDARASSSMKGKVVLTLQPVIPLSDLTTCTGITGSNRGSYILLEDKDLEFEESDILCRVHMQLYRGSSLSPSAPIIYEVFNWKRQCLRSSLQLHTLRAELEIETFGREHLSGFSARHQLTRSIPMLLFIDGFGVHRNMYCSLKAFYMIPAGLSYSERRKVGNIFTLTLGPHGASMEDVISSFESRFHVLSRGIPMMINGRMTKVNVFIMAITGDMPQQASNSGALSHQAEIGCRTCYCPKGQRGNLKYDVISNGRYHFDTSLKRLKGNSIAGRSEKMRFWAQVGLQPDPSPLDHFAPYLDIVLSRTYDIPHSEWKGLGRLLQKLLVDAILTRHGREQYLEAFQNFTPPVGWPRIQSPQRHIGSWSLSENARAIILTPLILRCNARPLWFRASYLEKAAITLRSIQPVEGLRDMNLLIYAYAQFACAASLVSTSSGVSGVDIHGAILKGRAIFQNLVLAASGLTSGQLFDIMDASNSQLSTTVFLRSIILT
jgi:hypothetical protein